MRIPFGHRHLQIDIEKTAPVIPGEGLLTGASDREVQHFVNTSKITREPRWEAHTLMLGMRN
jgi:hypothetical protein